MNWTIKGRTALITGAARGIGAATARRLHADGATVALLDRDSDAVHALADELGPRATAHAVDVTDIAALHDAVAVIGRIDIAIANAGVAYVGSIAGSPQEELERTIEINLLGVMRTNRAVLAEVTARQGYILNVASQAAVGHMPLMGAYAASKAGVEAFTNSLRMELKPSGVAVGCAYFGWIDTDMVRDSLANPAGRAFHELLPGSLSTPIGADIAADVLVDAINRRSARAWAPRHVGPSLALRGITQPLTELALGLRRRTVGDLVDLSEH